MSQGSANPFTEFLTGVSIVLGWNILIMFLGITIPVIGLVQLVYIIPWSLSLYRQEKRERLKGVIVGAVITFLLNGACWLWIISSFPG